jgi:hypothetical protein
MPLAYCFPSNTYLNSPKHFFINISLSFPRHKPLKTFALIDGGTSVSCISDRFAERHSLPHHLKDVPMSIMAVEDHPVANGLVTYDIVT